MDFAMFVAVNAALFIRPGELIPALEGVSIYNYIIIANLIVAFPKLVNHFQCGVAKRPVTACVLGVFVALVVSHLVRFDAWNVRHQGYDFAKVVAYYLLLVSVVNTHTRIVTLLGTVACLTILLNGIAVLHYHGYIELPTISVLMENDFDEMTGQAFQVPRMRATGIFNDPNDLSMIIVGSIVICLGGLCYKPWGTTRLILMAPVAFLVYALTLTQSRGGLLALGAALAVLSYLFYGRNRTILLGVLVSPLAILVKGRQADLAGALSKGSGGTRVELWSAGLQLLRTSPVFGIGANRYEEEAGQVAHNSFVQGFTELGLVGGGLFLGMFVVLFDALWQLNKKRASLPAEQQALLPFLTALLVAYFVSMQSLSRNYVQPTYLIAGAVACFVALPRSGVVVREMSFNGEFAKRVCMASVLFITSAYVYIKIFFRVL